jgi:putative holliday junction resolvase
VQRYLGVDYGVKRLGLAVGNSEAKLSQPLTTIPPEQLLATIEQEGPFDAIVVGLPRSLDGTETPQTLAVRRFTDDVLGELEVEVVFQDEAGTSSLARERLEEAGKPFKPERIDAEAAALILQDYLDTL